MNTKVSKFYWKKWHQQTCLIQGCLNLRFVKGTASVKHNKAERSKMRSACKWSKRANANEKAETGR